VKIAGAVAVAVVVVAVAVVVVPTGVGVVGVTNVLRMVAAVQPVVLVPAAAVLEGGDSMGVTVARESVVLDVELEACFLFCYRSLPAPEGLFSSFRNLEIRRGGLALASPARPIKASDRAKLI
jgi:hypothetical protein